MATLDASETMQTFPTGAFRQLGWAFLFLGISIGPSIRLGNENFLIDLLPDFIGYLLIATAANRLVPLHHRARGIRNLAMLLTYLSVPTVVQYTVATAQAGNITTWKAPLWPLAVVLSVLELVLVWRLCGLVADLARRAGDVTTEQRALVRRVVYIFFKILLSAGVALVLLAPNRELILGGAIAAVGVGLLLLGLMMGLMWRAERMCAARPEVARPPAEAVGDARPGGWAFRWLALGGVLLPSALAAGAVWYYLEWQEARHVEEQKSSSDAPFTSVSDAFYAHLLGARIDEAYASTTANFRSHTSRDQLAELARKYVAYVNRLQEIRGASGAGSSGGHDFHSEYHYAEVETGKIVQVSITIRRDRDSILFRRPPPLRVDDFKVEEKAAPEGQWPGFGRPRVPGR